MDQKLYGTVESQGTWARKWLKAGGPVIAEIDWPAGSDRAR
jgi:hypothetical protein